MRARLTRAFDTFVDAREMSDVQLAERIAADQVHILVDLDGYTRRNRAPVLQFRPAPLCAHYLGYPGTLGSPDVDYLIADSYVIPPGAEQFFREAVVRLPGCYQANDDQRVIPDLKPTRREAGLPDDAFVFCAFNRPYKITPDVFDVWMRILRNAPASVLWLLRDNIAAEANLRKQTAAVLAVWMKERGGGPGDPLFPTRRGTQISRGAVERLVAGHAITATAACPAITGKNVTPHTLRHSCAMSLLAQGVDTAVIALWLGHERVDTTQIYVHADMSIKERALARTAPPNTTPGRYRPVDSLLAFLNGL